MIDPTANQTAIAAPAGSAEVRGRRPASSPFAGHPAVIRSRYDAAQTSDSNARHWQWADGLSARSANSPGVRRTLRNRTRYEVANNCYASGIVESLADYMVGTGPLLQMMTGDPALDETIETNWAEWCEAVCFADKLHTTRQARAVDGEGFIFLESDPSLGDIQLDIQLYEGDQIATPYLYPPKDPNQVDGIEFDEHKKPVAYHLLKEHPGDNLAFTFGFEYDRIPARYVIHWFLRRRPDQYRGIPELTPALGLFAQLRRFGIATLAAAEFAAANTAVVYTDLPPQNGIDENTAGGWDVIDYEHGMFNTLPAGWKMNQFEAKHPTANHEMFKRTTLEEIARTLKVPYNIAAGNSSGYNYASGRLDHQAFYRAISVDQGRAGREICSRVLREWLMEAAKSTNMLPGGFDRRGGWPHRWIWPAIPHVDPLKEANAQKVRMESMTTTFSEECYRDGTTPEHRMEVMEREIQEFERRGLPNPYLKSSGNVNPQTPPQGQQDQQGQQDGEEPDDGGEDDTTYGGRGAGVHLPGRNGFHRP